MKPFFFLIFLMANLALIAYSVPLKASDHLTDDDDMSSLLTLSVSSETNSDSEEEDLELSFPPGDLPISLWPDELILSLLNSMPFPNLVSAMRTCKKWKRISNGIFSKTYYDYILHDEQGKERFLSKGPFYQVQDLFFRGLYCFKDLKYCDLFPRLCDLVHTKPTLYPIFWQFAISEPLVFNYSLVSYHQYHQITHNWLIYGKILFLLDPLNVSQCLEKALLTLRNFINNDFKLRSKNLDLLKIFTLSSVKEDRDMLRDACNYQVSEHLSKSRNDGAQFVAQWLEQVEIQWQFMDSFKVYAQAQLQEAAAAAAATATQAQPE